MKSFADVLKDSPGVGDVHVSSTGAPAKPKKPTMFNGAIAQSTKLPVTGATAAALIEDPEDAAPVTKLSAPRSLKPIDEDTAHTPFPHDANALGNLRQDQIPRFFGALTNQGANEDKTVRLSGLTAMQDRVDPAKVEALRDKPGSSGKAVVVRANGRNYIADGHHRLTAAWLNGENTADVKFKDLTAHDNALKRFEPPADPDWSIPFAVAKADAAQQLIFGWASVVEKDGRLIIDKQGDAILPEDLEKAAYDFVLHARQHGEMHKTLGTGRMVESMVFTKEKQAALGVDLGKVGWWIGFKVDDAGTWASHARGELPEFSIGGSGRREDL